jgi:hypothetical protein
MADLPRSSTFAAAASTTASAFSVWISSDLPSCESSYPFISPTTVSTFHSRFFSAASSIANACKATFGSPGWASAEAKNSALSFTLSPA